MTHAGEQIADQLKREVPHTTRHFDRPPTADEAVVLLSQLNGGICRYAPRQARKPLAIYGAGTFGQLAISVLRAAEISLDLVVDRAADQLRHDSRWAGVTVMTPDQVPDVVKESALLGVTVATSPFTPIESSLRLDGWTDVVPFYDIAETLRYKHPLSNGWFAEKMGADAIRKTEAVLRAWHDDTSRAHHLQFLAWRLLREEWFFASAPVTLGNRYLIPEVLSCLSECEVFLDGGAHRGEAISSFIDAVGGTYKAIYAVEPDADSREVFQGRFRAEVEGSHSKIKLAPYALDAVERSRKFHSGLGYASQLSDTGQEDMQTRTIDSMGVSPTFLKLHLEGHELAALQGGLQTILSKRPIVTVTTYHNEDGIWQIPDYMMKNLPNYRFLMRLHSWCGTGAVVYGVPLERAS
ncbi:FkbM family methyltransferase [Microvirga rosea]|uniref:FkbM family methyltransferase n=1 Tax=Microvirga rosea TaxID=2715425 RepID=UPI001D0AE729|nr:FkbM family methyltransferase [Microvirga rosea]MCB8823454.1 FkbM family methyltransferase [Microvirga rosea]